jgi:hypothetical protein
MKRTTVGTTDNLFGTEPEPMCARCSMRRTCKIQIGVVISELMMEMVAIHYVLPIQDGAFAGKPIIERLL